MVLRGQVLTMRESFAGLIGGLIFAMLLVYLLMVVNFQSWVDPLIIIMCAAARTCGNRLDAVCDRHYSQRARADGSHHVHGRRNGE